VVDAEVVDVDAGTKRKAVKVIRGSVVIMIR
jgi:hypothetical protein